MFSNPLIDRIKRIKAIQGSNNAVEDEGFEIPEQFDMNKGLGINNDLGKDIKMFSLQKPKVLAGSGRDEPVGDYQSVVANEPVGDYQPAKVYRPTVENKPVDMTKPYLLEGGTYYTVPGARHGTRGNTDSLIVHRTAGHGFHPNDPRLTDDGFGAHVTITRDGKMHQVGSLNDKMWHAGPGYNNRSVGMEVAGKYINGAWEPMTDAQKVAVEKYGRQIVDRYGISPANIKHHASVAAKTAGEGLMVENLLRGLYK